MREMQRASAYVADKLPSPSLREGANVKTEEVISAGVSQWFYSRQVGASQQT